MLKSQKRIQLKGDRLMSQKRSALVMTGVLSLAAMGVLSGCPPNAYHVLTLSVTPITGGTIAIDPDRATYFSGTEVSLEAIPNEGFKFQRWVGTGMNTTINPTRKRVYADETILAEFAPIYPDPEGESTGEGETETITVKNGDFESGSGEWTAVSLTNMTILCDVNSCGTVNGISSAGGNRWAWFGNSPLFNYESGTLFQEIQLPVRQEAYLKFDMAIPQADIPFQFQVLFDGLVLAEWDETDALLFMNYQPVFVDISDLADGRNTVLTFMYSSFSTVINPEAESMQSVLFLDNVIVE